MLNILFPLLFSLSLLGFADPGMQDAAQLPSKNKTMEIFTFNADADLANWQVVDDVVMGGRSSGNFRLNEEGHGVFSGRVSLENNGGFSSVRYGFPKMKTGNASTVVLRVKGDGKRYQFRLKSKNSDSHSYIQEFQTNGEWQDLELPLADFYPTFRGRKLNMPNYPGETLEEIRFLIANKRAEQFQLEIHSIALK